MRETDVRHGSPVPKWYPCERVLKRSRASNVPEANADPGEHMCMGLSVNPWCSAFGASRMPSGNGLKSFPPSLNGNSRRRSGGSSSAHAAMIFDQSNGPSVRFPFTITGMSALWMR